MAGGRRWGAHASRADLLFRQTSGRSPGVNKTVSLPGPDSEVQGGHAREPLPTMGVPGMLPLLLLVQACIPGRGRVPAPALGTDSEGGEGGTREEGDSKSGEEERRRGAQSTAPALKQWFS